MRTLSHLTAVLACLAVLLVALPAQAAPAPPSHSTPLAVAQWLGSVWFDLAHSFTARPGAPAGKGHTTLRPKGGSCLDPNGASGGCITISSFGPGH
jgi:hypothetical protein